MTMQVHSKTRRRLALLFSVPLAFSLVFFFVNQAAEHRESRLLEIQSLSTLLTHLRAAARDAEAGERGFFLTGEDRFLAPLIQARIIFPTLERQVLANVRDRPAYQAKLHRLLELAHEKFRQAEASVQQKRAGAWSDAALLEYLDRSQDTMDEIRKLTRELLSETDREEVAILDTQRTYSRWSFIFFVTGSLLMIGVIVWLYNALLQYLAERDIANANLRTANLYLEARIDDRTRDLTNANAELQQFAYVASHDLQEPLRTITSFSQLLAMRYKGRLDQDADDFINYIVSASRRMTDLINGLLALVRLRHESHSAGPVCFEELLAQAEISLQASIRENGARIERGHLPCLVVDSVQISQVLQNLLSNAIKYRGPEPPVIRLEAIRDATNWIFSVKDNGRGFDPQFSERIFGIFQRLNNREVDGTGMGLAISRKIIERHGGRMWAHSNEGAGSTFFFSLPVTLEDPHETESAPSSAVASP